MKIFYAILMGLFITAYAIAKPIHTTNTPALISICIVLIALSYFFLIRPQHTKARACGKLARQLDVGKTVKLSCGIIGKITAISPQELHLQIANDTIIRVDKHAVSAILPPHDMTVTTLIEE